MDCGNAKATAMNARKSTARVLMHPTAWRKRVPIVYACSGCSSAAQMTNHVAVQLDRRNLAEMSCIAGVGGEVTHLLKMARSGRPIVALDGCRHACVRNCLTRHGVAPTWHHVFSDYGVRRRHRADFDRDEAEVILERVLAQLPEDEAAT